MNIFPRNIVRIRRAAAGVLMVMWILLNSGHGKTDLPILPVPEKKVTDPATGPSDTFVKLHGRKEERAGFPDKAEKEPMVRPGELLVRFRDHVKEEQKKELHAFWGSTLILSRRLSMRKIRVQTL